MAEGEGAVYSVQYLDGDREQTSWISRAGRASVKYASGDSYIGSYNGMKQRHGSGIYKYSVNNPEDEEAPPKTAKYEGDFRLGKKYGMGQMVYPDGAVYNGSWVDDKRSGNGSYTYPNGDVFSGTWADDKKEGPGSYYYAENKSQLVGEWKANTYVNGKWVHADNTSYHSQWSNNVPKGDGIFYFAKSGNQLDGTYVEEKTEDEEAAPTASFSAKVFTKSSVNGKELVQSTGN
jgi:radial spoke head protein 1